MTIEHLEETVRLPYDEEVILEISNKPERFAKYFYEFVKAVERKWLQDLNTTVNLMLDKSSGNWVYLSVPDQDGVFSEGSWRIGPVSRDNEGNEDDDGTSGMEMQQLTSGTWEKASRTTM